MPRVRQALAILSNSKGRLPGPPHHEQLIRNTTTSDSGITTTDSSRLARSQANAKDRSSPKVKGPAESDDGLPLSIDV